MEERREPRIFHDVCHLASLWKWLRLNRLFPMHEAHGPRTGDGSGLTTLYRGTEVSNVAPLCQLPWHITTHDLLHFFFLFMDVYSTFFPQPPSGSRASFFLSFNGRTIYEFTYTAVGYRCSFIVTILCLRKKRGLLFFSVGFYPFIDDRSFELINKHKRFLQSIA